MMIFSARIGAKKVIGDTSLEDVDELKLDDAELPYRCTRKEFYDALADEHVELSAEDELVALLVLSSCLAKKEFLRDGVDDEEYNVKLSLWISDAILPNISLVPIDNEEEPDETTPRPLLIARHKAILGLRAIKSLNELQQSPKKETINPKVLLAVVTFTSTRDQWTSVLTSEAAYLLLDDKFKEQALSDEFMLDYILNEFIRPLFWKSRPKNVTATGRKTMDSYAPSVPHNLEEQELVGKPWKYDYPYAITVFEWVVNNAPKSCFEKNWHLFVPPLLALLDSNQVNILERALHITISFLSVAPGELLGRTNLDCLLSEALTRNCEFWTSNRDPISESLLILPLLYDTILALAHARFPATSDKPEEDKNLIERKDFLDYAMRTSIVKAYLFAEYQQAILDILIIQTGRFCSELGLYCVKYLTHILPLFRNVLQNPMNVFHPRYLLSALKSLEKVIQSMWVRFEDRATRREVLWALVAVWMGVKDCKGKREPKLVEKWEKNGYEREKVFDVKETSNELSDAEILVEVRYKAKEVGRLIMGAIQGEDKVANDCDLRIMVRKEESFKELFGLDADF